MLGRGKSKPELGWMFQCMFPGTVEKDASVTMLVPEHVRLIMCSAAPASWPNMMDQAIAAWQGEQGSLDDAVERWALRRGGARQQVATAALMGMGPPEDPRRPPSCLASLLAELNALGLMSASRLQEISMAAMRDGCDHPEVQAFGRIAAGGDCPGNASRDLNRLHQLHLKRMPDPFVVRLPLYNIKASPPQVAAS